MKSNFIEKFARKTEFENGEVKYQKLIDHIEGVSNLTEEFVSKFFTKNVGKVLGLLHDLGKYSDEFQQRIRGENIRVDHSTAGAIICDKLEKEYSKQKKVEALIFKILKYPIIGHHCGLLNYGASVDEDKTITSRLNKENDLCDFSEYKNEIPENEIRKIEFTKNEIEFFKNIILKNDNFAMQMLIRFLFSSLVDADRLDAQKFSEGENSVVLNKNNMSLEKMLEIFNDFMEKKRESSEENKINKIRNEIFESCIKKSSGGIGIYSLCVPTGGGKTLSSLAFALNHGVKNSKDRVIYSLPFMSIIEQNAKVYSNIFGEENVLEHHCNFNFSNEFGGDDGNYSPGKIEKDLKIQNSTSEKERKLKYKLSTENWDMPLIITTNVQFFESTYSSKTSSVRKLHNIFNSVIILDEAQVIPNEYLEPCTKVLEELVKNYNCTILICTATQPEFQKNGLISENFKITEIIDDTQKLFEDLKRVEVKYIDKQNVLDICEKMNSYNQVLTIVNTKSHAKEIFENLEFSEGNFHLSTNMYPNHRRKAIEEIRERLSSGKECRVVSTQLIEAGVDVDFPVVFRSVAGIDSIIQASGRCNREGKRENSFVYVFSPEDSKHLGEGYLKLTAQTGMDVINTTENILSLEAISKYFSEIFFNTEDKLDKHGILKLINNFKAGHMNYDFESISNAFNLIESQGVPIIIPHGEAEKILNSIKNSSHSVRPLIRKLNSFSVNIPEKNLKYLIENGDVYELEEGIFVLKNLEMYDLKFGFDKNRAYQYDYVI